MLLINETNIEFEGIKSIKKLTLELSKKKINVLIGENGTGKTKALESLFTTLLLSNKNLKLDPLSISKDNFFFNSIKLDNEIIYKDQIFNYKNVLLESQLQHNFPVVYIPTQHRGNIYSSLSNSTTSIHTGTLKDRKDKYKQNLLKIIETSYDNTLDNDVNGWFINIAYSSNKYQAMEENREIELITVLRILNKIDSRIDPNPENFKIVDGFAQIMVDGEYLKLNELSSGFVSILKIVQSIVSGYGIFTNSDDIENVTGYVLIDEIESHLHLEWQTKILPTLNEIFPNTYFIVTTHSPLILYQLYNGAAFKLEKNKGYIKTVPIDSPSRYALIDLLDEIFDIDLNKIKLERKDPTRIQRKSEMLNLLRGGVA